MRGGLGRQRRNLDDTRREVRAAQSGRRHLRGHRGLLRCRHRRSSRRSGPGRLLRPRLVRRDLLYRRIRIVRGRQRSELPTESVRRMQLSADQQRGFPTMHHRWRARRRAGSPGTNRRRQRLRGELVQRLRGQVPQGLSRHRRDLLFVLPDDQATQACHELQVAGHHPYGTQNDRLSQPFHELISFRVKKTHAQILPQLLYVRGRAYNPSRSRRAPKRTKGDEF